MYDDQQQARPYGSTGGRVFLHQFKHGTPGRGPVIFAVVIALVGLAVSTATMALLLSYKSSAQAQVAQLQAAVASAQAAAQGRASASTVSGLAGKVSTISGQLSAMAPFSKVCSTDLTGPNGPAEFFFLCTDQKP